MAPALLVLVVAQVDPAIAEYRSHFRFTRVRRDRDEAPYIRVRKLVEADALAKRYSLDDLRTLEKFARESRKPLDVYRAGLAAHMGGVTGARATADRMTLLARTTEDGRTYEYARLRFLQESRQPLGQEMFPLAEEMYRRETDSASLLAIRMLAVFIKPPKDHRMWMDRGIAISEKLAKKYPVQYTLYDLAAAYDTRHYEFKQRSDGLKAVELFRRGLSRAGSPKERAEWVRSLRAMELRMKL